MTCYKSAHIAAFADSIIKRTLAVVMEAFLSLGRQNIGRQA